METKTADVISKTQTHYKLDVSSDGNGVVVVVVEHTRVTRTVPFSWWLAIHFPHCWSFLWDQMSPACCGVTSGERRSTHGYKLQNVTLRQSNMAFENHLYMEVSRWEHHLDVWDYRRVIIGRSGLKKCHLQTGKPASTLLLCPKTQRICDCCQCGNQPIFRIIPQILPD